MSLQTGCIGGVKKRRAVKIRLHEENDSTAHV